MLRIAVSVLVVTGISVAQQPKPAKQVEDMSKMSPEAHAPLFQTPKSADAGALTNRVTAGLPAAMAGGRLTPRNFIDEQIFGKMQRDGIPHAPLATDQEFLRRVMLDLTGRIPTPAEVRDFLADTTPDKRVRLTEKLIGSLEFVDKWSYFYMDLVRANGKMQRGVELFHRMIKDSLAADRPYDDLARSMTSSSGKSNFVVAAINPIAREHVEGKTGLAPDNGDDFDKINQTDTHDEISILFGKIFLGINLSCIGCHDGSGHLEKVNVYLSQKKRTDFFQQAAFFGNTRYIQWIDATEFRMGLITVDDYGKGYDTKEESMLRMKRTGGPNAAKFILTDELARPGYEPRDELARMLTSHPQFARATVNLFWSRLMGVGFVEPWDEFDLARQSPKNVPNGWDVQPSHPELLDQMAAYFRKHNYSLHKLFSAIVNSNAYQLSARFPGEWKDSYTKYYARKYVRMLGAEELHDAIAAATERLGSFGGRRGRRVSAAGGGGGRGGAATADAQAATQATVVNNDDPPAQAPVTHAMQVTVPNPSGELKSFLQAFGQANRGTPARLPQPSPLQPIMLIRSSVVNDRVLAANDSRVQRLLDSFQDNGKVVDELFLGTLSRAPLAEERAFAVSLLDKGRKEGAQNVQWALLNLVEFLYNF
jgi:hypothetical protein